MSTTHPNKGGRPKEYKPDYTVEFLGSLCTIKPRTVMLRRDLVARVAKGAEWVDGKLVIEPRYMMDLVRGLAASGYIIDEADNG